MVMGMAFSHEGHPHRTLTILDSQGMTLNDSNRGKPHLCLDALGKSEEIGRIRKMHLSQGLNSHYFHIVGDGHQPNSRGLYTHCKDSY